MPRATGAVRTFLVVLAAGLVALVVIALADRRGFRLRVPSDSQVLVQPGQEIRVRMKSREQASVMAAMDQSSRGAPLSWIAVDRDTFSGKMLERPTRPNIPIAAQEQLVVELYSK